MKRLQIHQEYVKHLFKLVIKRERLKRMKLDYDRERFEQAIFDASSKDKKKQRTLKIKPRKRENIKIKLKIPKIPSDLDESSSSESESEEEEDLEEIVKQKKRRKRKKKAEAAAAGVEDQPDPLRNIMTDARLDDAIKENDSATSQNARQRASLLTADGRFIDSESKDTRLLERIDVHSIANLRDRLGKTARERLTVPQFLYPSDEEENEEVCYSLLSLSLSFFLSVHAHTHTHTHTQTNRREQERL